MRPISKWLHTDPNINPPIQEVYRPYSDAKVDLERNIDGYCSYCERPATDDAVHVEHIQPKGLEKYKSIEFSWSNFLLSCARCNGADNKADKDVVFGSLHLPHLNNTTMSIQYKEGGFVRVNDALEGASLANATALVQLVGLDKRPGHANYLPKDKRWDRRREVWEIAQRYLKKYEGNLIDEESVKDLAKGYGFWSVWYHVFDQHSKVKRLLISAFRGTAIHCFDAQFNPIPRNSTDQNDPI